MDRSRSRSTWQGVRAAAHIMYTHARTHIYILLIDGQIDRWMDRHIQIHTYMYIYFSLSLYLARCERSGAAAYETDILSNGSAPIDGTYIHTYIYIYVYIYYRQIHYGWINGWTDRSRSRSTWRGVREAAPPRYIYIIDRWIDGYIARQMDGQISLSLSTWRGVIAAAPPRRTRTSSPTDRPYISTHAHTYILLIDGQTDTQLYRWIDGYISRPTQGGVIAAGPPRIIYIYAPTHAHVYI